MTTLKSDVNIVGNEAYYERSSSLYKGKLGALRAKS